jgi:Dimethlysulfonioproprionate lyase
MDPTADGRMTLETSIRRLLQEIDTYLGRLPGDAGTAAGILSVRTGLARWQSAPVAETREAASPNPTVLTHLDSALIGTHNGGQPRLASAIAAVAPLLNWVTYDLYPRAEIGEAMATGHAFTTLIGEGSFFPAEDFDLGLFLIAPHTLYRDHHHAAPELYAPLTGPHGWRFSPDDSIVWRAAHQPVWNPPWQPHATLTGSMPFLCIFGWTRDTRLPAKIIPATDWYEIERMKP